MTILADVQNANVDRTGEVTTYASSSTAGWHNRIMGQKETTVTIDFLAQGDGPDISQGDTGTLTVYYLSTTHFWAGLGEVMSVNAVVPIEGGDPVGYNAEIKSTGAWAYTGTGTDELLGTNITVDWV